MDFYPCVCRGRVEMTPNFLTLQQVVEGSHVDNLTKVIVKSLLLYGVFSKSNLALKLVCFGIDDVTM
jgi:hypothetical protein